MTSAEPYSVSDRYSPVATREGVAPYWLAITGVSICIAGVNLMTRASNYADFDTYVMYLDGLVHFPPSSMYYFEPLSNAYLLFFHLIFNTVEFSIVFSHYVLGAAFVALLMWTTSKRAPKWQTVLFVFAVLGPLLAFVTLRATPAYFLVAVAVQAAVQRKPSGWLFLVIATLFHISALLALIPLLALYTAGRMPRLLALADYRKTLIVALVLILILGALLTQFSAAATSLIQSIPVISKYTAYTETTAGVTINSVNHYIFLAFVTLLTITFFAYTDKAEEKALKIYLFLSFLIYVFLFAATSPVAAFRQTPFWLLPMITMFPWRRVGVGSATTPIFLLLCAGLFYFQFNQVYT